MVCRYVQHNADSVVRGCVLNMRRTTLYKYIPTKDAETIIRNGKLKMSDGTNFNDPFELTVVNYDRTSFRKISGLRILCLTGSRAMKLMWSHYADSHRGLCLAVEVPADKVYPVCYTGTRARTDSDIDDILRNGTVRCRKNLKKTYLDLPYDIKVALLKDKKWSYEKEYRIVCNESDVPILDGNGCFFPVKIKRVYLGCRFEENEVKTKNSILRVCKGKGIEVKQMQMAYDRYALKVSKKEVVKQLTVHEHEKELALV